MWAGHCKRGHVVYGVPLLPPSFSFSIPSAFTWVPTLALTHLLVPQASFTGHMAGVCAGLARAYCVEPGKNVVCLCMKLDLPACGALSEAWGQG